MVNILWPVLGGVIGLVTAGLIVWVRVLPERQSSSPPLRKFEIIAKGPLFELRCFDKPKHRKKWWKR